MDVYEALYTTRMMRPMKPDPIPMASQCRILDAAIRAPNGGNAQRWHFLVVDDRALKAEPPSRARGVLAQPLGRGVRRACPETHVAARHR